MAFVDGTAALSAVHDVNDDQSVTVAQKPRVAPRDLRRVRLAGGMMLALLIVDLALYLPRFF
jgi:hypothetical protein